MEKIKEDPIEVRAWVASWTMGLDPKKLKEETTQEKTSISDRNTRAFIENT